MKKFYEVNKKKIFITLIVLFLGVLFFSYNITLTWDSSEYLGLANLIGTDSMQKDWIKHRGIAFPLILKLLKPFGIENKFFILLGLFLSYILMITILYKIYQKLKELDVFKNKKIVLIFVLYILFFIIFNPIIFGYYHSVLTEFIAITVSILMCFLCFNWIEYTWDNNKRKTILYAITFSLITIFIYHIKQSLVTVAIIPLVISAIISIINNLKRSNILSKLITLLFVGCTLIFSIQIWNLAMKDANVAEATNDGRVKNKLISGISTLGKVCDDTTIKEKNINWHRFNKEDLIEIKNVLYKDSEYSNFQIFQFNNNENYIVFFSKEDYSFKEQIKFYSKILFTHPLEIIHSYYKGYKKMIFVSDPTPLWKGAENSNIPIRIYINYHNIIDLNVDYTKYIEKYFSFNTSNIISSIFNAYVFVVIDFIMAITKLSLWVIPILWLIMFLIYLFVNKKVNKNILKLLQFTLILYTTSFGGIISYVIFGACIDRYFVPMIIPAFIAIFLTFVLFSYFLEYIFKIKK